MMNDYPVTQTPETSVDDAGIKARDLLEERSKSRNKFHRFLIALTVFLVLITVSIAGILGKYAYDTKVVGRFNDMRMCSTIVGKYRLTGTRTYSYPYVEILGYRLIDSSKILEETKIDIKGNTVTVVGIDSDQWWSIYIGKGEQGTYKLKQADTYIFTSDDNVGVVDYSAFCNNTPEVVPDEN